MDMCFQQSHARDDKQFSVQRWHKKLTVVTSVAMRIFDEQTEQNLENVHSILALWIFHFNCN